MLYRLARLMHQKHLKQRRLDDHHPTHCSQLCWCSHTRTHAKMHIHAYDRYHDEEWGRPLHDDVALFELLCLEGAQVRSRVHSAGREWC